MIGSELFEHEMEPDPRLERVQLLDDPYQIVLPPRHRLAVWPASAPTRLRPAATPPGTAMLERLCAEAGFTADVAFVVDSVTVAPSLIAAGVCVALMPDLTVPQPRPDVAVKPVAGVPPFRSVVALWAKGRRGPGIAPMVANLQAAAKWIAPRR